MSKEEANKIISMIYGYARKQCSYTPLDYRDVAHTVVLKNWIRISNGEIRYPKAYLFLAVYTTVASMINFKYEYNLPLDTEIAAPETNIQHPELESLIKRMSDKEQFIVEKTLRGYSRLEIADMMGISRIGVNVIWFRMIQRLRGIK